MGAPVVTASVEPRPAAWERPARIATFDDDASRVFTYVLLRVTGLMLSVLVLGHFAVTHFVTDVARDNSAFVARRFSSVLWIAWDATMLAAALAHGAAGIRLALADYSADAGRRRFLERCVVSFSVVLFVVGVVAITRAVQA
jgi:succinate dehydrogenase / fumarate reductase, membrane anchor subunit